MHEWGHTQTTWTVEEEGGGWGVYILLATDWREDRKEDRGGVSTPGPTHRDTAFTKILIWDKTFKRSFLKLFKGSVILT